MRVTLESTTRIVEVQTDSGVVPGRVWEGRSESGIPVFAVITRIAADRHAGDLGEFEAELAACRTPSIQSGVAIPARLVL